MVGSRRAFLKTAGAVAGVTTLPRWALELEAAEAAALDKAALADVALATAKRLGAVYADVRINRYRFESVATREAQVQQVQRNQSFGFGVRVLVKGTWGFAASRNVSADEVRRFTGLAVEIAKANAASNASRSRWPEHGSTAALLPRQPASRGHGAHHAQLRMAQPPNIRG